MAGLESITQVSNWRSQAGVARLAKFAPVLVSLGLVAMIAWVLADLLWSLAAPPESAHVKQVEERLPKLEAGASDAAKELFGHWDASAPSPVDSSLHDAVETKLPLTLVGVFVSDTPGRSGAIISSGRGEGSHYGVGDTIPGNAILESVDGSGVMLRRGARRERLSFSEADSISSFMPSSSGSVPEPAKIQARAADGNTASSSNRQVDVSSLGEKIQTYRKLADEDPRQALTRLGLERVSESQVQGYRVGDLPDNQWVAQTGLQDGDILLSVNGHRIGNPDVDRLEIDNFLAEGQVRLEIKRGERRFFVNAKLTP